MAGSNSGLIKVALIGGAAYFAYRQGWLSFLGLGSPAVTTAAPAPPVSTAPPVVGANSLDGIHAQLVAMVKAPAAVDEWDYALNQIMAPLGKTAPDPMPIFSAAVPGFSRGQLLTDAQYWGIMAPALKAQLGLSGLGMYGGLAALSMGSRWRN